MNNTNIVRHGEVILKEIDELPQGAELKSETKSHIVAHSETGHHHILDCATPFKVYDLNGDVYFEVKSDGKLWHQKTGKNIHTTHKITPAIYKVILKKEFDYFKAIIRTVRD